MYRITTSVLGVLLCVGAATTGCAGAPQPDDQPVEPAPSQPAAFTAHALVSAVQPHKGDHEATSPDATSSTSPTDTTTVSQLLSSEAVLRDAGLTADQISLAQSSDGLRLEVTAASAPLALAQCSSMLLSARLHAASSPPERRWVETGVERLRDELGRLEHSFVVAPPGGACAHEKTVPALKMCAERRIEKLSQEKWSPRQHLSNCDGGLLCAIAEKWAAEAHHRSERAQRYGSAHPEIVEADQMLGALESWFDTQRKTDVAGLRSMLSHIEELPSNLPANGVDLLRVEVAQELLEAESFAIDAGVPSVAPWPVRLAAYEYGVETLELQRLQLRYKHKHPVIAAHKAMLERMRREFGVLVEFQRARLEGERAMLQQDKTRRSRADARLAETRQKLEELLGVLEAAQALASPQPAGLQIVQTCTASKSPPR